MVRKKDLTSAFYVLKGEKSWSADEASSIGSSERIVEAPYPEIGCFFLSEINLKCHSSVPVCVSVSYSLHIWPTEACLGSSRTRYCLIPKSSGAKCCLM